MTPGEAIHKYLTADAVVWTAAVASLALLLFVRPATDILFGRRQDRMIVTLRAFIVLLIILTVALPALVLLADEPVSGLPYGCFLLTFQRFCYYLGKIGACSSAG